MRDCRPLLEKAVRDRSARDERNVKPICVMDVSRGYIKCEVAGREYSEEEELEEQVKIEEKEVMRPTSEKLAQTSDSFCMNTSLEN